jgi:ketosteroid isomerase-like protein
MAAGFREFLNAWEQIRIEADEYRELDGERVLAIVRFDARGKVSGLELGQTTRGASLFHIAGGRVTRLVTYFDAAHALADLGLAPDTGSPS